MTVAPKVASGIPGHLLLRFLLLAGNGLFWWNRYNQHSLPSLQELYSHVRRNAHPVSCELTSFRWYSIFKARSTLNARGWRNCTIKHSTQLHNTVHSQFVDPPGNQNIQTQPTHLHQPQECCGGLLSTSAHDAPLKCTQVDKITI
jgi:hypothetical protein